MGARLKPWSKVVGIIAGAIAIGSVIGWRWLSRAIDEAMRFPH